MTVEIFYMDNGYELIKGVFSYLKKRSRFYKFFPDVYEIVSKDGVKIIKIKDVNVIKPYYRYPDREIVIENNLND